jgi:uncharacterized DUF497 family protein
MFDWDEANIRHLAAHGVTPIEAQEVLLQTPLDLDAQIRGGEQRSTHLGETKAGRILFVIVTWRGDSIRVVTAYPAKLKWRRLYADHKKNS